MFALHLHKTVFTKEIQKKWENYQYCANCAHYEPLYLHNHAPNKKTALLKTDRSDPRLSHGATIATPPDHPAEKKQTKYEVIK